ncbi:hypothetical protein Sjap_001923 [Stephania japonica]|uniref:Uncharacterized protein n=1 Tax=Stephania japonica TaxID=461633 RepID=A0AAP0KMG3_9MAGN
MFIPKPTPSQIPGFAPDDVARRRVDEEKLIEEFEKFTFDTMSVTDGEDAPQVPLEELLEDLGLSDDKGAMSE